jgi:hypothetical protein
VRASGAARIPALLGAGLLLAACTAPPLPEARPRLAQPPARVSWDSQACAWEAQNASGYQADLSPEENTVYNLLAYGRPGGASGGSDPLLSRGGATRFAQVFGDCLDRRGYDPAGRRAEAR